MGAFILRMFRQLSGLHLIAPLVALVIVETLAEYFSGQWQGRATWLHDWFSFPPKALRGLVAVYFTFFLVYLWLLLKEGATQVTDIGAVDDVLRGATSYFAVSTTPVREWFEPAAQVYLVRVVGYRLEDPHLRHQRVQIFFSDAQLTDIKATHLDGYHGQCFSAWHDYLNVPLALLKPHEIRNILAALPAEHRRALCGWARALGLRIWLRWPRWRARLAFAFVEGTGGHPAIVLFKKRHNRLSINRLDDGARIDAYVALAQAIKARVYLPGTTDFAEEHKLARYLRP